MAARTPRKTFATPFVVTLAAVPACYVQPAPQPQPVVTSTPQPQSQPSDSHPVVISNPPRPQPAPPPKPSVILNPPRPQPQPQPQAAGSWHVFKTGDGCEAIVNVQCPHGAACNPPPPQKYACPPGIVAGQPLTIVTTGAGDPPARPRARAPW